MKHLIAIVTSISLVPPAAASVMLIQADFDAWAQLAAPYTTIDFTGFPNGTNITDQYSGLGVLFTDPDPNTVMSNVPPYFPLDGSGMIGESAVDLSFAQGINAVSFHFHGFLSIALYSNGSLAYQSPEVGTGGWGVIQFAGVVSDTPFDLVLLRNGPDWVGLDNLYFSTIPGPGGVALLAMAALSCRGRRR